LRRRLGYGEIELTHEAFHTLEPWWAAAHLRELLLACGVLAVIDKQICLFANGDSSPTSPTRVNSSVANRIAAVIVLRYAQPLSRVVRLTVDGVVHDGNLVLLRLGEPSSPPPTGRGPPDRRDPDKLR
jgi:hypothetical protein